MSDELEVLKIVAERLNQIGIPYMITGSIPVSYYAIPRMTRDIDMVIELEEKDVEKITSLFSGDFYIDKESVQKAVREKGIFNIIHNTLIVKIDFIIRKENTYRKEEFRRRRKIRIEETEAFLTTPEDLILSKLYWSKDSRSEMQILDVKNLLQSVRDLDKEYIKRWADYLGISEFYLEVSSDQ
ncbi:MAG: hypothetical protein KAW52_06890 [candidate division Zixibacteria bacterium]|nr:hypothetical protein [candidate division Zixibacteria bacterium]